MSAYLAFHHTRMYGEHVADRYGNDPFVWVWPPVWSHCHARTRPLGLGTGASGALVHGHDAVFFCGTHPLTGELAIDAVLVLQPSMHIQAAEANWPQEHPIRHYHFDQERDPGHAASQRSWIAHPHLSFLPQPAMPVGAWIDDYLSQARLPLLEYFAMPRRKSARKVVDPQGLYQRLERWTVQPGRARLAGLPLRSLQPLPAGNPILGVQIDWNF